MSGLPGTCSRARNEPGEMRCFALSQQGTERRWRTGRDRPIPGTRAPAISGYPATTAAFASFWLSRSTDSEKITLPQQETTPLATRDGQIWRVVWSRIWLGLPAALPPCSLTSSLSGKAPCMRAREGISAPPSCERASPATGPSHRHSPTQPHSTRNRSRQCRRACPLPAQAFPR